MKDKFTIEQKIKMEEEYLKTHESIKQVAENNNTSVHQVTRILHGQNIRYGNKITNENKEIYKEKHNKKVLLNLVTRDDK